jgi:hypothetical protein
MLDGLPYQVKRAIARRLSPFYIHTLGSACSEWREMLRPNQRALSNRRTLPGAGAGGDYDAFLARFPGAETLRLYGNGRAGYRRLYGEGYDLEPLGAAGPKIRTLGLSFCTFLPWTFRHIGACGLTSLELESNQMRDVVARIAPTLEKMSTLVSLSIRNNEIGFSAPELSRAIARLTRLESLCLAQGGLGARGATALAPALSCLTRLRSLDLRQNLIACDGAAALATTLRALTALTELNIDANAIGAQGFAALYSRGPPGLAGLMHGRRA